MGSDRPVPITGTPAANSSAATPDGCLARIDVALEAALNLAPLCESRPGNAKLAGSDFATARCLAPKQLLLIEPAENRLFCSSSRMSSLASGFALCGGLPARQQSRELSYEIRIDGRLTSGLERERGSAQPTT